MRRGHLAHRATKGVGAQRKGHVGTQRGGAICQPGEGVLGETKPADAWTCEFQPLEPQESKFLLFKLCSLGCFVIAALANEYASPAGRFLKLMLLNILQCLLHPH